MNKIISIKFFFVLFVLILNCLEGVAQKRYFGVYKNIHRYWGDLFVLKEDSSFIYNCHDKTPNNIEFFDNSSGTYKFVGDTIFFVYSQNNYHPHMKDSLKDSLRKQTVEPKGYFGNRPQKLYWRRKRLYYIDEQSGYVIKGKEYYLKRIGRDRTSI